MKRTARTIEKLEREKAELDAKLARLRAAAEAESTGKGNRKKLTKTVVDAALPNGDKPGYVWDTDVRGFGLKIMPTGKKIYLLAYRMGGRETPGKRIKIGQSDDLTIEQARRHAERYRGDIADGIDPLEERQEQRKADRDVLTIAGVAERWLTEKPSEVEKKDSSWRADEHNIRTHVIPWLGRIRLDALSPERVTQFREDVKAGRRPKGEPTVGKRGKAFGGRGIAIRTLGALSAMLSWAVRAGLCESNPAKGVRRPKAVGRERFLSVSELGRLGAAMDRAEKEGAHPMIMAVIRMLLYTGARKGEIVSLRWEWIDWDRGFARLPTSKTGKKELTLPPEALQLLADIKAARKFPSPFVFPGFSSKGHLASPDALWRRVRAMAGLDDVRIHDLRHTYVSFGASTGVPQFVAGRLVGHRRAATTDRYAHLFDSAREQGAAAISGAISAALAGGTGPAEVVPIRKRGRAKP